MSSHKNLPNTTRTVMENSSGFEELNYFKEIAQRLRTKIERTEANDEIQQSKPTISHERERI